MTDLADEAADALELLQLEVVPDEREVLTIRHLLRECRALVGPGSERVVVVSVEDSVRVQRGFVSAIVAMLLRDALRAAPAHERVAVTAQEIEGELVVAVFARGARNRDAAIEPFAHEAAVQLGGRVWSAHTDDGQLAMLAVPLYGLVN